MTKPVTKFGRNRSRPDGLAFYCRSCFSVRSAVTYRRRRVAAGRPVRERPNVGVGEKYCPGCQQVVPLDGFDAHPRQSGGRASYCKPCKRQRDEDRRLLRQYGLDRGALAALRDAQAGRCALCRRGPAEHVDHDHVTGTVRGLLCFQCNVGLGNFRDDAEVLRLAADYVAQHSWQKVLVAPGVFRTVPPQGVPEPAAP